VASLHMFTGASVAFVRIFMVQRTYPRSSRRPLAPRFLNSTTKDQHSSRSAIHLSGSKLASYQPYQALGRFGVRLRRRRRCRLQSCHAVWSQEHFSSRGQAIQRAPSRFHRRRWEHLVGFQVSRLSRISMLTVLPSRSLNRTRRFVTSCFAASAAARRLAWFR
jgi:hypothetical protein